MNKTRNLLALLFLASISLQTFADDYAYLTFTKSDGTETSVNANGLKITYSGGTLYAVNGETYETFKLTDLTQMYFSNATGINDLSVVNGTSQLTVYTTSGIRLCTFTSVEEARKNLKQGIYVLKTDGKTYKIAVK